MRRENINSKTLIVNADDLGLSEGVNQGILKAHQQGIVTSTTAMVNMPDALAGIRVIQKQAPKMGIGLHINLTYGEPILAASQVPSLVQVDGRFVAVQCGLLSPRRWRFEDVEAEVRAQFERFVQLAGKLPDHLDSHQMIDSLSLVCRKVVIQLATEHSLPIRKNGQPLIDKLQQEVVNTGQIGKVVAPSLFKLWPKLKCARTLDPPTIQPDSIEIGFFRKNASLENLLRILGQLPNGTTEIVCHPGYLGRKEDTYRMRETELAVLTDRKVHQKVEDANITLTSFDHFSNSLTA